MRKIIVATGNEHKMQELRQMLDGLEVELISMKEAGITADIVENGTTFEENAKIKAKTISKLTGEIVIADDSGLEIDYLGGEPGIYSARYMGEDTSYEVKNQNLIDRVKDAVGEERSARFVCAMVAVLPDGKVLTTRGTIEGVIAKEPVGENGFGYDPIVFVPEYGMTTAQMSSEQKNAISHRGKAMRALKEALKKELEG